VQLAGEEINTKISELSGLGRSRNPNDLARSSLQDDQITHANEVAWNGDGIQRATSTWLHEANGLADPTVTDPSRTGLIAADNVVLPVLMVVVMMRMEGVEDAVGGTLDAAAEAMIVTFVVVVAHIVSVGFVGGSDFFSGDLNVLSGSLATIFDVVGRIDAASILTFSDV
jgi:hypothetical protein